MVNLPETAQTNDQGWVGIKYYQPGQPYIRNTPSGQEYIGITKANICFFWCNPLDLEYMFNKRGGCCGKRKQLFHYANESDVRRWTNNGGR